MSALGSDGIDGGSDDTADADLIPMMQGMMKSLLSKDVLYPSLKDISAQVSKLSFSCLLLLALCNYCLLIESLIAFCTLIVLFGCWNRQCLTFWLAKMT